MKKRIFHYMRLLVLFTILTCMVLGVAFSGQLGTQIKDGLKTLRVTMINESGEVIFDNQTNSSDLDNHFDRPEVIAAIENGYGESERYSNTLGDTTYYYAVRLENGSVLRLALTTASVYKMLFRFIPVIAVCLLLAVLLALLLANRLTKRIIAPVNSIDLDNPEIGDYEELLPLAKKVEMQKKEIDLRVADLENRENTIRIITENMQEGLLLIDTGGTIILANQSALHILNESDALGKNIVYVCRDADYLAALKLCQDGNRSETTIERNGRIYNVFFNPAQSENGLSGTVILFIDATERNAAERHRKEFSANVSHELKTPLTTISALSEMIANGTAKPQDMQKFGEKISTQSQRLIHIIDDIIKLSEFDEGELAKEFSRFDLHELAASVISGINYKAVQRNIAVELQGSEPFYIVANRRMMDELLYNLVDNAIKYNHDGGKVFVLLSNENGFCKIAVSDTGIGIPKEQHMRVFERFYRVDKSRSKKTGGTGLGLSIVKHIVELHNGRIEIESNEESGTCIVCLIPE